MQVDSKIPVHEIFPTVQGEGRYLGYPAVFIRLQGCNYGLKVCPWCDQADSTLMSKRKERLMEPNELFLRVAEAADVVKAKIVVVTGGEPTAFKYWEPLIQGLMNSEKFERCVIETNGSMKEVLFPRHLHDVVFSIAPKVVDWSADLLFKHNFDAYLKLTVGPDSRLINENAIQQFLAARPHGDVYVQPCDMMPLTGNAEATYVEAYEYFKELRQKYPKAKVLMGIQAHKIWGVR